MKILEKTIEYFTKNKTDYWQIKATLWGYWATEKNGNEL